MVGVAIAGAAVVGAGTTMATGSKAAKAQKNAAASQVAESQRQYDTTRADYAPWRAAGTGALSKLSSIYGIETPGTTDWGAYVQGNPDALRQWQTDPNERAKWGGDINAFGQFHWSNDGARRDLKPFQTGGSNGSSPDYSEFYKSPGYQFRLDEGQKAIERSAAARGGLNSGATMKALDRFSQGIASDEFGRYVGGLQSMAGIGQNATNATTQAGQASSNNIINAYGNMGNARASSYANTGSAINSGINNVLSAYLMNSGGGISSPPGGIINNYGIRGGNIY